MRLSACVTKRRLRVAAFSPVPSNNMSVPVSEHELYHLRKGKTLGVQSLMSKCGREITKPHVAKGIHSSQSVIWRAEIRTSLYVRHVTYALTLETRETSLTPIFLFKADCILKSFSCCGADPILSSLSLP